MQRLCFLLLLLLPGAGMFAQDSTATRPGNAVVLRSIEPERIARYQLDPDLDYDRDLDQEPNWWERFKTWLRETFAEWFGAAAAGFFASNLFIILCIVVVIIGIVVMSRGSLRRVFHGSPRSLGDVALVEEDIRGMDIEALIREAEADNDLRRAIRLHYLLVLRKLVDGGVLVWSPERTDREYLQQLKDPAMRSRFAQAAGIFQWVWYGHTEVDAADYTRLKRPFLEFENAPTR